MRGKTRVDGADMSTADDAADIWLDGHVAMRLLPQTSARIGRDSGGRE